MYKYTYIYIYIIYLLCNPYIYIYNYLIGGFNPSEKYESQLGVWNSQYMESHKSHVPNQQPEQITKKWSKRTPKGWLGLCLCGKVRDWSVRVASQQPVIHLHICKY